MKKIERLPLEPVMINGVESEGCVVHEKDLDELEQQIDELEADNPQVECPECEGNGNICTNCPGDCREGVNKICEYAGEEGGHTCDTCCGEGTISTVQAQEIKIQDIELQLIAATKRIERMIEEAR